MIYKKIPKIIPRIVDKIKSKCYNVKDLGVRFMINQTMQMEYGISTSRCANQSVSADGAVSRFQKSFNFSFFIDYFIED